MIVVIVGFSVSFMFADLDFIILDYVTNTILTKIIAYDDLQVIVIMHNATTECMFKLVASLACGYYNGKVAILGISLHTACILSL
jgi:hypothetical protein